jgi:hypothetical protein
MSIKSQTQSLSSKSNVRNLINKTITVLIVGGGGAGGGGGATSSGGGGGGGGGVMEIDIVHVAGNSYSVSIGAGGACSSVDTARSTVGNRTIFGNIISSGGGSGGNSSSNGTIAGQTRQAYPGACGGGNGVGAGTLTPPVTVGPGFAGGTCASFGTAGGGGGGGMAAAGQSVGGNAGGIGGLGKLSIITGSRYGGGGSGRSGSGAAVNPSDGGGGRGGASGSPAVAGSANTGGGGGGCFTTEGSGHGGSGVVILKFNSALNINIGAGLTYSSTISGSSRIVTITAGIDTVSFY